MLSSKLEAYIENHTTAEDENLHDLQRETHLKSVYPQMLSGNVQGKFLEMVSCMIQPEKILEIGTFTGYSAICLAKGLTENGVLHTIDNDPELLETSSEFIRKSGYSKKIVQHTGDALSIIPNLNELFDLVFIDAAKEFYPDYYHLVFPKLKHGGFILADNALWGERVLLSDDKADKETRGIKAFNDVIHQDERVENVLVSMRDGIMIIRKK